jgi:hypothetical protein
MEVDLMPAWFCVPLVVPAASLFVWQQFAHMAKGNL